MSTQERGDWDFDVIVLGTGLKECILSGLMSSLYKKKVLHMDRNGYYGAESASLNLVRLFEQFTDVDVSDKKNLPKNLGQKNQYNVDLCPKFLMACGDLVKVLLSSKVTNYLEFRSVDGSYVYQGKGLHKVPSTAGEGLSSSLLGFTQKIRFRSFINFVASFDANDRKTWSGQDVNKKTMADIYKYYKLDKLSQTFVSHALALEPDAKHLALPAKATLEKIKTYAYSVARFGKSPYIYPVYGLGGLPEAFTRLSAIHGGRYILNSDVKEILRDSDGNVSGVRFLHEIAGDVSATGKIVIGDPSYFGAEYSQQQGQTAKCVCIMNAPVPKTNDQGNCQIIIPNTEVKRANDIYVSCLSGLHEVCPKDKFLAVLSSTIEGKACDPSDKKAVAATVERELASGLRIIPSGSILKKFHFVTNRVDPVNIEAHRATGLYITKTMDPTSHFQGATDEVLGIYAAITGTPIDLDALDAEDVKNGPQ